MAAKPEGFFTNTNLMIAGLICAVIGAVLAMLYINRQVAQATGNPVKIAFAKKAINVNEFCHEDSVEWVDLPQHFVEKAGDKFVTELTLRSIFKYNPSRLIEAGEPLLITEFPTGAGGDVPPPQPPSGMATITLDLDQKTQPGAELAIGSIVSLTGNYDFSADRRSDPHTLPVLDKVKVVTINGFLSPTKEQRRSVRSIGVFVGEANALILTKLKLYQIGEFDALILGPNTLRAEIRDQVPEDTVRRLKEAEDKLAKDRADKDREEKLKKEKVEEKH